MQRKINLFKNMKIIICTDNVENTANRRMKIRMYTEYFYYLKMLKTWELFQKAKK